MEKMTQKELEEAFIDPKIGKTYRHFKGQEYLVVDRIPDGENDGEITIVYQNVRTHQRFTRSLSSWKSMAQAPRFTEVLGTQDNKAWHSSPDATEIEENLKAREIAFQEAMQALANSAFPDVPEFKTIKGDGFHLGDLKELTSTLDKQDSTAGICVTAKRLKRDLEFKTYIRKEIISAKVLEISDVDGEGQTIGGKSVGFIWAPKQESGKVVEHSGIIGEDYLVLGEGYIKIMNKEKFEAKYKLEVPF